MILKNKYKEQMSKICVNDEMKKRVMSKLRQSQEEKKEKKFILRGQAIYKYSGVVAACCALAVTYTITTHFPELMNNEERVSKQSSYDANSTESSSADEQNEKIEETSNSERNIIGHNEKENNDKVEENNLNIKENQKGDISGLERKSHSDNPSSTELNNSTVQVEQNSKINEEHSIKESGNGNNISADNSEIEIENSSTIREEAEYNIPDQTESNDNEGVRSVSYFDEESKQREYLFQRGIPDLSDMGYNINYVNQISQNEIEVMYLSDKETDLWIKICNSEDDSSTYKKDNNYEVYKNNKNYYIWSTSNIDSALMDKIIEHI